MSERFKKGVVTVSLVTMVGGVAGSLALLVASQLWTQVGKAQDTANTALTQISAVQQSNKDIDARLTRIENKLDNINQKITR